MMLRYILTSELRSTFRFDAERIDSSAIKHLDRMFRAADSVQSIPSAVGSRSAPKAAVFSFEEMGKEELRRERRIRNGQVYVEWDDDVDDPVECGNTMMATMVMEKMRSWN